MIHPARTTPLHDTHLTLGATMDESTGWALPLHYGSPVAEHLAVRREAGMFDVSNSLTLDLTGAGAMVFLRSTLSNDVARLTSTGAAQYSCLLDEHGGILDACLVYRMSSHEYRLRTHPAPGASDVAWLRQRIAASSANVTLDARRDLAWIAISGPCSIERASRAIPELNVARGLPESFNAARLSDLFISRTGFTGEDGIEIGVPAVRAPRMWSALHAAGVTPCGTIAQESLRIEAGMSRYGYEFDPSVTPFEAGLGWTVDLDDELRDFVGRDALVARKTNCRLVGLLFDDVTPSSADDAVHTEYGSGCMTSFTRSPSLERDIAIARVPITTANGVRIDIGTGNERKTASTANLPFIRHGRSLV